MIITSKFDSWCNQHCGHQIHIGDRCEWKPGVKGVRCLACLGAHPAQRRAVSAAAPRVPVREPLPPAFEALEALETQLVRMAAKTVSLDIERAWNKYEKVKALAIGTRIAPEQRTALKTALVLLITAIFLEDSAYVC